jgi:hypothetical protein
MLQQRAAPTKDSAPEAQRVRGAGWTDGTPTDDPAPRQNENRREARLRPSYSSLLQGDSEEGRKESGCARYEASLVSLFFKRLGRERERQTRGRCVRDARCMHACRALLAGTDFLPARSVASWCCRCVQFLAAAKNATFPRRQYPKKSS